MTSKRSGRRSSTPVWLTTSALVFCSASSGACADKQIVSEIEVLDSGRVLGRQSTTNLEKHVGEEARKSLAAWPGFEVFDPEKAKTKPKTSWQLTVRLEGLAEQAGKEFLTETPTVAPDAHPPPKPGEVDRACVVSMRLLRLGTPPKDSKLSSSYDGHALVRKNVPASEGPVEIFLEATRRAADDVKAAMDLEHASDDELITSLKDPNRARRARAIDMLREKKVKAALEPLVKIVRDESEDQVLVLAAIGALVAMKDERAVDALIDAGRNRSGPYITQLVFAVAEIGGRTAEGWLITVSSGHADPDVRKAAKQALDELERRREKKTE